MPDVASLIATIDATATELAALHTSILLQISSMVRIPNRLEDLYPASAIEKILDTLQQPDLSGKVREALGKVGLRDANPLEQVQQAWQQARSWLETIGSLGSSESISGQLNATGQLFGHSFAGVPIGNSVAHTLAASSTQFLSNEAIQGKMRRASASSFGSSHSACWLTSTHAGLHALLGERKVLIAKTDLVRIPCLGDLNAMLRGVDLFEVGAVNGCGQDDWLQAFEALNGQPSSDHACVLIVSPNGLSVEEARSQRAMSIEQAGHRRLPVFELLADGVVHPGLHEAFGFPDLKTRLADGTEAIVAPLDLFLGAPRGAAVVGSGQQIESIARLAALSGTELDGPSQLAAVVALQLGSLGNEVGSGPAAQLLMNTDNLKNRAERLAIQLNDVGDIASAVAVPRTVPLGPPPWTQYKLSNWAVQISPRVEVTKLHQKLLSGNSSSESAESPTSTDSSRQPQSPIASVIEGDHLLLDLRFIDPKDDFRLVETLVPETAL